MSVKLLIKGKGSFVPVIKSERTLNDVINQLDLNNVGGLVVTDDNHEILGIITEHDIARGLKNHGRNVVDRPLRDLMTRDVITVDINEPLTRVLELMDQHRIHYLPVTCGNGQPRSPSAHWLPTRSLSVGIWTGDIGSFIPRGKCPPWVRSNSRVTAICVCLAPDSGHFAARC